MKTYNVATIVFKGFFADEVPYEDGVPAWECDPYTGIFEDGADLMSFINSNINDPSELDCGDYPLAVITEYEITDLKFVSENEIDFERWEVK